MAVIGFKKSIIIQSPHQRDSLVEKLVSENIPYSISEVEDEFTHKISYVLKVKSKDMKKLFIA